MKADISKSMTNDAESLYAYVNRARLTGERWAESRSLAFPPSIFLLLAVCKHRGGRPGQFYHVNDISVCLGRQGRQVPD